MEEFRNYPFHQDCKMVRW